MRTTIYILIGILLIWLVWNVYTIVKIGILNKNPAKSERVKIMRRRRLVGAWANVAAILTFFAAGAAALHFTGYADKLFAEERKHINPSLEAGFVFVYDVTQGYTVYAREEGEHIAPASTTKLLTALTALRYCDRQEIATAGYELSYVASDASRAWLTEGDMLSVHDLLVAMLLPSGNDAAYVLACHTGRKICRMDNPNGDVTTEEAIDAFVKEMNRVAEELGAGESNFLTPDGYDTEGQYTTAEDLAHIAEACMEEEIIMDIVGEYTIECTWENGRSVTYENTNLLLNPIGEFYCPAVTGMKTGYGDKAGGCLISSVIIDGDTYICVVMNSSEEGRFRDSIAIYKELERQ